MRQVAAELDMVSVRETVDILGTEMRTLRTENADAAHAVRVAHQPELTAVLRNLVWWARSTRARRLDDAR